MTVSAIAQEYGYFFNSNSGDRTYNAESFETWMKPFFSNGVFNDGMKVSAQTTPDMTVSVEPGYANLDGKPAFWPTSNTITIATASGVYNRIDTIVLRRDDTNRQISIEAVTGTAALTPSPTPPTRNGDVFEVVLAQIYVGIGVTSITDGDITDTRIDPDLCGFVTCPVVNPDFSDLYDQFAAQFQTWFDHMKDQLDEDAAGHLQLEIDDLTDVVDNKILTVESALPLPAEGESALRYMPGLTEDHQLVRWNFSSSPENSPPASLEWATVDNRFYITNHGGTTSESIKPVFVLPRKQGET